MEGNFKRNAGPIWDISLGSKSSTHHQIFGLSIPAIGSLHMPLAFLGVELGFSNHGAESSTLSDVQNPVAGVKIIS